MRFVDSCILLIVVGTSLLAHAQTTVNTFPYFTNFTAGPGFPAGWTSPDPSMPTAVPWQVVNNGPTWYGAQSDFTTGSSTGWQLMAINSNVRTVRDFSVVLPRFDASALTWPVLRFALCNTYDLSYGFMPLFIDYTTEATVTASTVWLRLATINTPIVWLSDRWRVESIDLARIKAASFYLRLHTVGVTNLVDVSIDDLRVVELAPAPIATFPYFTNFTAGPAFPSGWIDFDPSLPSAVPWRVINDGATWWGAQRDYTTNLASGWQLMAINSGNRTARTFSVVLPRFDASVLAAPTLTFALCNTYRLSNGWLPLFIDYTRDAYLNGSSVWTPLTVLNTSVEWLTQFWQLQAVDLTPIKASPFRLRLRTIGNTFQTDLSIDDLRLEEFVAPPPPPCPVVTQPAANNSVFYGTMRLAHPPTATLGSPNNYRFSLGTNVQANNIVSSMLLAGGRTNHSYVLAVPPQFASGTVLYYRYDSIGLLNLTSDCGVYQLTLGNYPTVSRFPYRESFESVSSETPSLWAQDSTDGGGSWSDEWSGVPFGADRAYNGSYFYAVTRSIANSTTVPVSVYTPLFNVSSLANPRVYFWLRNKRDNMTAGLSTLAVSITTADYVNATTPWTQLALFNTPIYQWQFQLLNVDAYRSTPFRLRFSVTSFSAQSEVCMDEFRVIDGAEPPCATLVAPAVGTQRFTGMLQWTANSSVIEGYRVYVRTANSNAWRIWGGNGTWDIYNGNDTRRATNISLPFTALAPPDTVFYWQVVPYGDQIMAMNCPVWNFTYGYENTIAAPYTENFGALYTYKIPNMWFAGPATQLGRWDFSYDGWDTPDRDYSTPQGDFAYVYGTTSAPGPFHLYSALVNVSTLSAPQVTFWFANAPRTTSLTANTSARLDVFVTTDTFYSASNNWTLCVSIPPGVYQQWTQFGCVLTSVVQNSPQRLVRLRFTATKAVDSDVSIDDVVFGESSRPLCATANMTALWSDSSLRWLRNINETDPALPVGYLLSLGTDNPPTNVLNRHYVRANVTQPVVFHALEYPPSHPNGTVFYYQVIPVGQLQAEAIGCPVLSYTSILPPPESAFPYLANFGTTQWGALPPLWDNPADDSPLDWDIRTSTSYGPGSRSGAFAAVTSDEFANTTAWLYSPAFATSTLSNPHLSFWVQNTEYVYSTLGHFHIDWIDADFVSNTSVWRRLWTLNTPFTAWTFVELPLPRAASLRLRFVARTPPARYTSDIGIDDVRIFDAPASAAPSCAISSAAINALIQYDPVMLWWSSPTGLTEVVDFYQVSVNGTDGTVFVSDANVTGVHQFAPLVPQSQTTVRVVPNNVQFGAATDVDSCSVLTFQMSTVDQYPYNDDFESGVLGNWTNTVSDRGGDWDVAYFANNFESDDHTTGSGAFLVVEDQRSNSIPRNVDRVLRTVYSPIFANTSSLYDPLLTFWFGNTEWDTFPDPPEIPSDVSTLSIDVLMANGTWANDVIPTIRHPYFAWNQVNVPLEPYRPFTNIRFRSLSTVLGGTSDVGIDDVFLHSNNHTAPPCPHLSLQHIQYTPYVELLLTNGNNVSFVSQYTIDVGTDVNATNIYRGVALQSVVLNGTFSTWALSDVARVVVPGYTGAARKLHVRINAHIGTTLRSQSCPIHTVTLAPAYAKFPYVESFERGAGMWTMGAGSHGNWSVSRNWPDGAKRDHTTGSGFFIVSAHQDRETASVVLNGPTLDFRSLQRPTFDFWMTNAWNLYGSYPPLTRLMVVPANGTQQVMALQTDDEVQTHWRRYSADLSAYRGQFVSVSLVAYYPSFFGIYELAIDDVHVYDAAAAPVCPNISRVLTIERDLVVYLSPSLRGAVTYTVNASAPSVSPVAVNTTLGDPLIVLDVTPGTTYTLSFGAAGLTNCQRSVAVPAITSFPFVTNFDDGTLGEWRDDFIPDRPEADNGGMFQVRSTFVYDGPVQDHTTSRGMFAMVSDDNNWRGYTTLFSPYLRIGGLTSPVLSFWYMNSMTRSGLPVRFSIDVMPDTTMTWDEDVLVRNTNEDSYTRVSLPLDGYLPATYILIRFRVYQPGATPRNNLALDDITVEDAAAERGCPSFTSLTQTGMYWSPVGDASWYIISVRNPAGLYLAPTNVSRTFLALTMPPSNTGPYQLTVTPAGRSTPCPAQSFEVQSVSTFPRRWDFDDNTFQGWSTHQGDLITNRQVHLARRASWGGAYDHTGAVPNGQFAYALDIDGKGNVTFVSPWLDFTNIEPQISLAFTHCRPETDYSWCGRSEVYLEYSTTGASWLPVVRLYDDNIISYRGWWLLSYSLSTLPRSPVLLRFVIVLRGEGSSSPSFDDIIIGEAYTCGVTNVEGNAAGLSLRYDPVIGATSYIVTVQENDPNATLPQQRVDITNALDFSLPMPFGNYSVMVEPQGVDTSSAPCIFTNFTVRPGSPSAVPTWNFDQASTNLFAPLPPTYMQTHSPTRRFVTSNTLSDGTPFPDHSSGSGRFMLATDTASAPVSLISAHVNVSAIDPAPPQVRFFYVNNPRGAEVVTGSVLDVYWEDDDTDIDWIRIDDDADSAFSLTEADDEDLIWTSRNVAPVTRWTEVKATLPSSAGRLRMVVYTPYSLGSADLAIDDIAFVSADPTVAPTTGGDQQADGALSTGTIAGIAVGAIACCLFVVVGLACLIRSRKRNSNQNSTLDSTVLMTRDAENLKTDRKNSKDHTYLDARVS